MVPTKPNREDLKPGDVLCSHCTGKCCRYFALQIDTPTTKKDFDYIRWYMLHGPVSVFVEDGVWYLMVMEDCQHLLPDNRCGAYETRPQICRDYSTDDCEYEDDSVYEKLFETAEQLWEYAEAVLPIPSRKKRKSQQFDLPVVAVG